MTTFQDKVFDVAQNGSAKRMDQLIHTLGTKCLRSEEQSHTLDKATTIQLHTSGLSVSMGLHIAVFFYCLFYIVLRI